MGAQLSTATARHFSLERDAVLFAVLLASDYARRAAVLGIVSACP